MNGVAFLSAATRDPLPDVPRLAGSAGGSGAIGFQLILRIRSTRPER